MQSRKNGTPLRIRHCFCQHRAGFIQQLKHRALQQNAVHGLLGHKHRAIQQFKRDNGGLQRVWRSLYRDEHFLDGGAGDSDQKACFFRAGRD